MEKKLNYPRVGDFYFNEGGSLILIYFVSFDVFWGYNFSSKKKEFYNLLREYDFLDGGSVFNSIRLSTRINIDVENLLRAAVRVKIDE